MYLCGHIYGKLISQNSKYADLLQSLKSHNGGLNVICYVICRLKASFSKVLSSFRMSGSCLVIKVCLLSKECLLSLIMLECLGNKLEKLHINIQTFCSAVSYPSYFLSHRVLSLVLMKAAAYTRNVQLELLVLSLCYFPHT